MTLTNILASYETASGNWYAVLFPLALDIFTSLIVLEVIWVGIQIAVFGTTPNTASDLIMMVFGVALLHTFLLYANIWTRAVINTFIRAGGAASGIAELDPSSVFDQGRILARALLLPLGGWGSLFSLPVTLIAAIAAIIVLLAFAFIAATLLATLVEALIVTSGGILLLGFAGHKLTRGIAERYFGYLIAVSVHLLFLYLVIGVGSSVTTYWVTELIPKAGASIDPYLEILGGSIFFLYVVVRVPSHASALLSGGITISIMEMERMAASAVSAGRTGNQAIAPLTDRITQAGHTATSATRNALHTVGKVAGGVSANVAATVLARFRGKKP